MKKFLWTLIMLVVCVATEAKTVKITLSDGTVKVFTSSQLSAIDSMLTEDNLTAWKDITLLSLVKKLTLMGYLKVIGK